MKGFKLVIPATTKVATGHKQHDQGCGKHQAKKSRRRRTRAAANAAAIKDHS